MGQLPSNDCDRLREQVSASLDGELSQLESARLQAHLAGCAGCREFAATAGASSRLLQSAPLEELQFPVVLPSRRRLAAARKLQVAAAAAALTVTVGLSAGLLGLPIALTVIWIAVQAFIAAQVGLRFGARLGEQIRERSEQAAGVALILVALVLLALKLLRI